MTQQAANPVDDAVNYCKYQAQKGIPSLIALMQRTGADWQRCITSMSGEQAEFAPKGEWSALQVSNHFLEVTAGVNNQIAGLTGGKLPDIELDEATLAAQGGARSHGSVAAVSEGMAVLFDEIVALTDSLDGNAKLSTQFPHPLFGQMNILEWIAFQRLHAQDHIQQIEKNRADPAFPDA